ncbi:unnamed protein product, partial [Symbiodinium sp. CCMP2456]
MSAIDVEIHGGDDWSPTSVVEDLEGNGLEDGVPEVEEVESGAGTEGIGKRKRRVGERQGEMDDSPSKRGHGGTLTADEMRQLLSQPMMEMKEAWGRLERRVDKVEGTVAGQKKEIKAVHARQKVMDQQLQGVQAKGDATSRRVDSVEGDIASLKAKIDEINLSRGGETGEGHPVDPWGDYLKNKNAMTNGMAQGM